MRWGAYLLRSIAASIAYAAALCMLVFLSHPHPPFINYFLVVKLVSLGALLLLGWDSVKQAHHFNIAVPELLLWANRAILVVALVAFVICLFVIVGFDPNGASRGAKILHFLIKNSEMLALMPLFIYTLLNLVLLMTGSVRGELADRIREYLIFTDLPCAIPALALILLVVLTVGSTTPDGELVLAAGAATLIFVSNAASLAVNYLRPEPRLLDNPIATATTNLSSAFDGYHRSTSRVVLAAAFVTGLLLGFLV